MRRDDLEQLLRSADREAGDGTVGGRTPVGNADLLRTARTIAARRRRRDAAIVATAALPLIALVLHLAPARLPIPQPGVVARSNANELDVTELRAEIERLRVAADQRVALVERMHKLATRSAETPTDAQSMPLPPPMVGELAVDQAAFTLLAKAERIEQLIGPRGPAEGAFEFVIKSFPDSASARVARLRLGRSDPG